MDLTPFTTSTQTTRCDGWSAERKLRFLEHLAARGNVRAACASVGMSRETAYVLRRRDALFARGWAAALLLAREAVAEVFADRAIDGVEEKIYFRGELIDTRQKYDNRLLLALMARLDKLAEQADSQAARDTARFDAILGCIAGAEVPDELPADADGVPLDRAGAVAEAKRSMAESVEAARRDLEAEDEAGMHSEEEYAEYSGELDLELAEAPGKAAAEWDGWFAGACATVDALLGRAETPAPREPASEPPAPPSGGPETPEAEAAVSSPGTVSEVSGSSRAATFTGPDGRLYAHA